MMYIKELLGYARSQGAADIHVIAGRYKNPTSIFTDKTQETWSKDVMPYLDAGRHNVHDNMTIMSDYKIIL